MRKRRRKGVKGRTNEVNTTKKRRDVIMQIKLYAEETKRRRKEKEELDRQKREKVRKATERRKN